MLIRWPEDKEIILVVQVGPVKSQGSLHAEEGGWRDQQGGVMTETQLGAGSFEDDGEGVGP